MSLSSILHCDNSETSLQSRNPPNRKLYPHLIRRRPRNVLVPPCTSGIPSLASPPTSFTTYISSTPRTTNAHLANRPPWPAVHLCDSGRTDEAVAGSTVAGRATGGRRQLRPRPRPGRRPGRPRDHGRVNAVAGRAATGNSGQRRGRRRDHGPQTARVAVA